MLSVYGRLSLPPHTLYRFKTVSDAYVVFMTCCFSRYGRPNRILLYRRTFRCEETITITKPIRSFGVSAIRNSLINIRIRIQFQQGLIFLMSTSIRQRTVYLASPARIERATIANRNRPETLNPYEQITLAML